MQLGWIDGELQGAPYLFLHCKPWGYVYTTIPKCKGILPIKSSLQPLKMSDDHLSSRISMVDNYTVEKTITAVL